MIVVANLAWEASEVVPTTKVNRVYIDLFVDKSFSLVLVFDLVLIMGDAHSFAPESYKY